MKMKKIVCTLSLASILLLANAAFANAAGPGGTDPVPPPPSSSISMASMIQVLQTILGL